MITEAVVLAGGLGTRLREAIPDLPKAMAPVAGRPFVAHVIDYLRMQGVHRFIFSLGYKSEAITEFLNREYPTLDYTIVVEQEPLGTGGAVQLALRDATEKNILVANGDTLFKVDLQGLSAFHINNNAECTLALKPMRDFDRYGVVEVDGSGKIFSFREKQFYREGLINGGVYLLNLEHFSQRSFDSKFSFEKEYLEKFAGEGKFYGYVQDDYFIDIGIPADYEKAQMDLGKKTLDLDAIDNSWTLFLDRDGVINEELPDNYVTRWDEFIFSAGVLETFKKLSDRFGNIIVVSNQRGVGKGLMTEEALQSIHLEMQREVQIVGGHIDKIYYCTEKDDKCYFRKPNPGMALQAKSDFPEIDFSKSIMVGNKMSDMKFGRAAGMYTVFIASTNPHQSFPDPAIDMKYKTLNEFSERLEKRGKGESAKSKE